MRIRAALFAVAFWTGNAVAQDPELPPVQIPFLPRTAANAEGFAPRGWRVETKARGDLNGDGAADIALTLRTQRPLDTVTNIGMGAGRTFDSSPHILAIAFASRGGGYRLAVQNHVLIPRAWDPTQAGWMFEEGSLRVSRGALIVELAHLQSSAGVRTFRFRWQDRAFRLIGYDFSDVHRYTHCTNIVSINYLTGRMRTTYAAGDDDPERVRWRRLPARALPTLDRVGDGMEFDPEGAIGAIRC